MVSPQPSILVESFQIGSLELANRVVLAPLAGIGNWFVRLQAKRYGAGLVVSEMVSSFGIYYDNSRTHQQFLRIHPDEHPVAVQLFGHDATVMAHAAETVAKAGADLIDINMGCPVRKVRKTGAGASLLADHDRAVAVAAAARSGSGLPVTVKLRSGLSPGSRQGIELAKRLVDQAGVAAIAFHPRPAGQGHKGKPDYSLAAELAEILPVPLIVSGGMNSVETTLSNFAESRATAVMVARGGLGNPWLFSQLLGLRSSPPTTQEVVEELRWIIAAAADHLGAARAGSYLRKFYPWYADRMDIPTSIMRCLVEAATIEVAAAVLEEIKIRRCCHSERSEESGQIPRLRLGMT